MTREIVPFEGIAAPPAAFNHVVRAGGFLFLTSQLSADLKTNTIIRGGIREQTKRAMDNVVFLLEAAGSGMDDVVRMAVYLRHACDFEQVNDVYRGYFPSGREPARVTVQAASPIAGIDIEIEATAVAPPEAPRSPGRARGRRAGR